MNLKKLFSMILVGVTSIGLLAGCGSNASDTQDDSAQAESQDNASDAADEDGQDESSDAADEDGQDESSDAAVTSSGSGNVLVVYYSATGNTETVANYIADAAGGTLFEVEPAEPYTDDDLNWTDENSRVSREHEDESLRDVELVTTEVENWDSYDTVFIGYPKMEYSL